MAHGPFPDILHQVKSCRPEARDETLLRDHETISARREDSVKRTPDIKAMIKQLGAHRCGSFSPCSITSIAGNTAGIAGQG
jgi:hypothetical protein